MLKLERSPSHSWWWDSHNSPKHSRWLQSNLQDLDEKVKEMLRLIEEDADSFAQRAQMYYQKRPELVNLVEEFYRAYRSLAERYDHLTGEIRQNIPRALQVQYGLSCDSPKSTGSGGGQHQYSPLRKSHQIFESLLKKANQPGDKKMEGQSEDQMQSLHDLHTKQDGFDDSCNELSKQNAEVDPCVELHNKDNIHSPEGGLASSSSDSEVDNFTPLEKLRQEIKNLEEENKVLADSHQKTLQLNTALQRKIKALEDDHRSTWREADALKNKVDELNKDSLLRQMEKTTREEDDFLATNIMGKKMQEEILPFLQEEHDPSADDGCVGGDLAKDADVAQWEQRDCLSKFRRMQAQSVVTLLEGLQGQVALLMEENRNQKLAILERGEEKREAIRQLCFSMDVLKSENRRLEVVLSFMKKRLHASSVTTAAVTATTFKPPLPAWKKIFCIGDRKGSKAA